MNIPTTRMVEFEFHLCVHDFVQLKTFARKGIYRMEITSVKYIRQHHTFQQGKSQTVTYKPIHSKSGLSDESLHSLHLLS